MMGRWAVTLRELDSDQCFGEYSRHRFLWTARRRARIEAEADKRLNQLDHAVWTVERV